MISAMRARWTLAAIAASLGVAADRAPTAFDFADFASTRGLHLLGHAEPAGNRLRLTPALRQTTGAAWFAHKQPVSGGFETEFQFQLTDQGGLGPGADGFAFVLQNSGTSAIAGRGSAGGFALGDGRQDPTQPGIPNSIAVFFDTFRNDDGKDPSDNYIAICTNGSFRDMRWPPPRLAVARKLRTRLKDGQIHRVRIWYKPPVMSVYLDGRDAPVLRSAVDLSPVIDATGTAYVGFTASTGNGFENHDILNWSFSALRPDVSSTMSSVSSTISYLLTACMPDRNLCTPDRAIVEKTGPEQYHIILPAHLEWGASIPNPSERMPLVSNATGTICWDLGSRGADGCSGPAGNTQVGSPGAAFLAPNEPAGALVSRTKGGRTYFSVNDRGGSFRDNEGYFEFDVRVF